MRGGLLSFRLSRFDLLFSGSWNWRGAVMKATTSRYWFWFRVLPQIWYLFPLSTKISGLALLGVNWLFFVSVWGWDGPFLVTWYSILIDCRHAGFIWCCSVLWNLFIVCVWVMAFGDWCTDCSFNCVSLFASSWLVVYRHRQNGEALCSRLPWWSPLSYSISFHNSTGSMTFCWARVLPMVFYWCCPWSGVLVQRMVIGTTVIQVKTCFLTLLSYGWILLPSYPSTCQYGHKVILAPCVYCFKFSVWSSRNRVFSLFGLFWSMTPFRISYYMVKSQDMQIFWILLL